MSQPHESALTQQRVAGDELKRRPLTQFDATVLGITDLASAVRRLRRQGRSIETVYTRRPSRYHPEKGQRVGMYVDMERPYAKRAIKAAEHALEQGKAAA